VWIFGSSRSFIGSSSFFFVSGTDVVFLTCSATSRPQPTTSADRRLPVRNQQRQPTQGGAAAVARRRHGLEVEDKGLLKDLVVIFVFLVVLCTVRCFF
jgi:hypothetical protein